MNCKNCGFPLTDQTPTCPSCNTPNEYYNGASVAPVQNTEATPVAQPAPVEPIAPAVEPAQIQPAPVITSSPEQKKSNAGLIVVIIILGILVLGMGAFIAIKFLFPVKPEPTPEPTTTEPETQKPTTPTTPTTTTDEDYMVVGNSKLGYLKLPGKWTKGSVAGASATALQYVNDATVASTAKGSYIVTLNVWKETADSTTAKSAAEQEANYYKLYDSDATNIKVEQVKLGTLDAYKLSTQYKSDSVWVISWYIDGSDGLVHIIQVEGLDLTNDYFKIPTTFSFTEIK